MKSSIAGQVHALMFSAAGILSILAAAASAPIEKTTVAYRKVDGHEIFADVYRPKDNLPRPVIANIRRPP